MANCHRDPKKRAYREKDFMPKLKQEEKTEKPKQTANELLTMLRAWNAASGGKEVIHEH